MPQHEDGERRMSTVEQNTDTVNARKKAQIVNLLRSLNRR
jgi:hypothetical protein